MNVGLIAHESKKKLMQNFCIAYRGILSKHSLYATGTTGSGSMYLQTNSFCFVFLVVWGTVVFVMEMDLSYRVLWR